jgi:rieske iron-sulfur protein
MVTSGGPVACEKPRHSCGDGKAGAGRRALLQSSVVVALATFTWPVRADEAEDAAEKRPQVGDMLVDMSASDSTKPLTPADIKQDEPPVLAWPLDPATKKPRDGSRFNMILLVKVDPSKVVPEEAPHVADGVVAFSAICTHQQCPVTGWEKDQQVLLCPCHQSEYDPKQNAKVVGGPAPRPLPALPLKIENGALLVAGPFIGRVGGEKPGAG